MFGLPDEVSACLSDRDGVVTQTVAELLDKDVR